MKRCIAALVCVMVMLMVSAGYAATSRKDGATEIADYCLTMVNAFLEEYEKDPEGFSEYYAKAAYHYYRAYDEFKGIERAESAIELGDAAAIIYVGTGRLEKEGALDRLLEEKFDGWIDGEAEKEEMLEMLKIIVNGISTVK